MRWKDLPQWRSDMTRRNSPRKSDNRTASGVWQIIQICPNSRSLLASTGFPHGQAAPFGTVLKKIRYLYKQQKGQTSLGCRVLLYISRLYMCTCRVRQCSSFTTREATFTNDIMESIVNSSTCPFPLQLSSINDVSSVRVQGASSSSLS